MAVDPSVLRRPAYPGPFRRAWLQPKFWGTWVGLAVLRVLAALPRQARQAAGRALGRLIYKSNAKRRRIVDINLAWCFPELDAGQRAEMGQRYFRLMGQTLLDYGLLWWASARRLDRLVEWRGQAHLQRCLQEGRPVILLTGHGVALDVGAAALAMHYKGLGLVKTARNPLIDWYMNRGRTRFHARVYAREEGIRGIVRGVRAGMLFYYLPDEDLGETQQTVFAPFFQVPTATLTALGRLTRLCNAAVLPCMAYYDEASGRYTLHIDPPLEDFPTGDDLADATRMNRERERMIRRHPEQYMWSLRLFQTRPAGETSPYKAPDA